ncbi:hypothetical protein BGZ47_005830, partial [Haplosporangium gracile]
TISFFATLKDLSSALTGFLSPESAANNNTSTIHYVFPLKWDHQGSKDDFFNVVWDAELAKVPIDLDTTVKLVSNMAAPKAKPTFPIRHSDYSHKSQPLFESEYKAQPFIIARSKRSSDYKSRSFIPTRCHQTKCHKAHRTHHEYETSRTNVQAVKASTCHFGIHAEHLDAVTKGTRVSAHHTNCTNANNIGNGSATSDSTNINAVSIFLRGHYGHHRASDNMDSGVRNSNIRSSDQSAECNLKSSITINLTGHSTNRMPNIHPSNNFSHHGKRPSAFNFFTTRDHWGNNITPLTPSSCRAPILTTISMIGSEEIDLNIHFIIAGL